MSDQLAFPGLEPAPKQPPRDRLFFAALPDPDIAQEIALQARALRGEHGLKGRPIDAGRLHITLYHADDFDGLPKGFVDASCEAAATVSAAPFDVVFDRVVSFRGKPGNLPFVLRGGDGLVAVEAFQHSLFTALAKAGAVRRKYEFVPHVTLLYDGVGVPEQPIESVSWTVREFVLIHSLLGQTRHITLGRWPLQG